MESEAVQAFSRGAQAGLDKGYNQGMGEGYMLGYQTGLAVAKAQAACKASKTWAIVSLLALAGVLVRFVVVVGQGQGWW